MHRTTFSVIYITVSVVRFCYLLQLSSLIFCYSFPCSPLSQPTFREISCLYTQGRKINQSTHQHETYSKIEAMHFSETSINFERTSSRYYSEDRALHNHCCQSIFLNRIILRYMLPHRNSSK
jgi:hypothetical protein